MCSKGPRAPGSKVQISKKSRCAKGPRSKKRKIPRVQRCFPGRPKLPRLSRLRPSQSSRCSGHFDRVHVRRVPKSIGPQSPKARQRRGTPGPGSTCGPNILRVNNILLPAIRTLATSHVFLTSFFGITLLGSLFRGHSFRITSGSPGSKRRNGKPRLSGMLQGV